MLKNRVPINNFNNLRDSIYKVIISTDKTNSIGLIILTIIKPTKLKTNHCNNKQPTFESSNRAFLKTQNCLSRFCVNAFIHCSYKQNSCYDNLDFTKGNNFYAKNLYTINSNYFLLLKAFLYYLY